MTQTLAVVVHGESGAGKSYVGGTTPAPRLVLECEGGARFVKANRRKILWDPLKQAPPVWNGEWDACFVPVLDWPTLFAAYQHLATGNHPFKSVVVDSLTEAQKRLVDDVAGVDQPTLQEWGVIGRNLEDMVRKLRDLTFHPKHPIEAVVLICLSHLRDGQTRPFLKGSIELSLPSFVDVVGYLYTDNDTEHGGIAHRMLINPVNNIIAKDRPGVLSEHYGPVVTNANITEWLTIIEAEFGFDPALEASK